MIEREFSSFRDNSGYVYFENNQVYRLILYENIINFEYFISSGLSKHLINSNLVIDFQITEDNQTNKKVFVEKIPIISYPAEWSFSMLKDAALLTINIQLIALSFGMTLKDASAYNIQFYKGKPIFIDLTSFEISKTDDPWVAYHQFCKHFLAPLALMSKVDISLNKLLFIHLDGIPLDLVVKLLPINAKFNLGIYLHIILHNKFLKKYENIKIEKPSKSISIKSNLLNNLKDSIHKFEYQPKDTEWVSYYLTSVEAEYLNNKKILFENFLQTLSPQTIWDIGANDGFFSKIASNYSSNIVATDIDPAAIENLYLQIKSENKKNILPLCIDISNTNGGFGWENKERKNIIDRINSDTIVALALIHHLRITYSIPLEYMAAFFAKRCQNLIIEFVPKIDEKVQKLLQNRSDIFEDYSIETFRHIFGQYFEIKREEPISKSSRILFLLKLK